MPYRVVLDDEVVAVLKRAAEPLVDSVNGVLRRKFGLPPTVQDSMFFEVEQLDAASNGNASTAPRTRLRRKRGRPQSGQPKTSKRMRAPKGSILEERAYWEPILRVLADAGGSAPSRDVVDRVGEMIAGQLKPLDLEPLETGGVRWQNRTQFARLRMKERGLLEDAPRGIWKISSAGRRALERGEVVPAQE